MYDLTNLAEIRNVLRTACSPNINRLLFQLLGSETLIIATEEQLLHQIRLVAVKGLHKEVHRHTFHNIRQQEGEGIAHFLAKLQSQVRLCELSAILHLTWSKGKFHWSPPEPPLSLKIKISLMAESHAKFGRTLSEKKQSPDTLHPGSCGLWCANLFKWPRNIEDIGM